ncbi:MAG: hypothetical protein DMF63_09510 [Acidobacteria bacterium]|nr:MAG: hypothetical protein DMF63_09510 [Acidobacteriota bacterium]
MATTAFHQPVILLLGERRGSHEVDKWLKESRYSICEATNVFQALEHVSDFTVGEAPDVVFLHVDRIEADMEMLENMLMASAPDFHPSVIAYANRPAEDSGLVGLALQLEKLIPVCPQVN